MRKVSQPSRRNRKWEEVLQKSVLKVLQKVRHVGHSKDTETYDLQYGQRHPFLRNSVVRTQRSYHSLHKFQYLNKIIVWSLRKRYIT